VQPEDGRRSRVKMHDTTKHFAQHFIKHNNYKVKFSAMAGRVTGRR
jgi:hypothetical protein